MCFQVRKWAEWGEIKGDERNEKEESPQLRYASEFLTCETDKKKAMPNLHAFKLRVHFLSIKQNHITDHKQFQV